MCDATHPSERQNELQHGDVAYNWRYEQQNIDADQRGRLVFSVRIETVTELGHELFHQPLGLIQVACRRGLHRAVVVDQRPVIWGERHL